LQHTSSHRVSCSWPVVSVLRSMAPLAPTGAPPRAGAAMGSTAGPMATGGSLHRRVARGARRGRGPSGAAIDGQMGWAKRAARGTTRFGPAQARPGPHKDGPGRHGPLWRAMLGPLPRHVGRHEHGPFKWMARFGPLYVSLHIKICYVCDCLNILYLNIGQYMTTCICVSLYVC
jgi:hypothetical protein